MIRIILATVGLLWAASAAAAVPAASKALTFYGVELGRQEMILVGDFEAFAAKNTRTSSFLWKYPQVDYSGKGDVFLAGYFLDRKTALRKSRSIPGSKVISIRLLPWLSSDDGKSSAYLFPLYGGEDSVVGDLWVGHGEGKPRRLEHEVMLGAAAPENLGRLKLVGFSNDGKSLVYCLGRCWRQELATGKRSSYSDLSDVDRNELERAVGDILEKSSCPRACAGEGAIHFSQAVDDSGYFLGACPVGQETMPLEIRLRKGKTGWESVTPPPNCKEAG